jgi:hypothetical protein
MVRCIIAPERKKERSRIISSIYRFKSKLVAAIHEDKPHIDWANKLRETQGLLNDHVENYGGKQESIRDPERYVASIIAEASKTARVVNAKTVTSAAVTGGDEYSDSSDGAASGEEEEDEEGPVATAADTEAEEEEEEEEEEGPVATAADTEAEEEEEDEDAAASEDDGVSGGSSRGGDSIAAAELVRQLQASEAAAAELREKLAASEATNGELGEKLAASEATNGELREKLEKLRKLEKRRHAEEPLEAPPSKRPRVDDPIALVSHWCELGFCETICSAGIA